MKDSAVFLGPKEIRLLRELQADGRVTNVELAARTGMSESPCLRRVRALESAGLIQGYTAVLDRRLVGFDVMAYIQINLDQGSAADTRAFLEAVRAEDRIVECHAMSGAHDYLLKVLAHSIDEFSDLTMGKILRYPGVKDVSSALVLKEIKNARAIPL